MSESREESEVEEGDIFGEVRLEAEPDRGLRSGLSPFCRPPERRVTTVGAMFETRARAKAAMTAGLPQTGELGQRTGGGGLMDGAG